MSAYDSREVGFPGAIIPVPRFDLKIGDKVKVLNYRDNGLAGEVLAIRYKIEVAGFLEPYSYVKYRIVIKDGNGKSHTIYSYRQHLSSDLELVQTSQNKADYAKNDAAMTRGGIDFNAAHLDLQIKRDGNGVPLPINQQDLDNIHIDGLIPVILDIKPAIQTPLLSELQGR